jgi:hypothetical protein
VRCARAGDAGMRGMWMVRFFVRWGTPLALGFLIAQAA